MAKKRKAVDKVDKDASESSPMWLNRKVAGQMKKALLQIAKAGLPRPALGDHRKHASGYTYHELAQALKAFTTK